MANLKPLPRPPMGILTKPCHTCGNTWGYADISVPAKTDPYYIVGTRKSYTIIIQCGLCGREQEASSELRE